MNSESSARYIRYPFSRNYANIVLPIQQQLNRKWIQTVLPDSNNNNTSAGRNTQISYCPACQIALIPWHERHIWKCSSCGTETPFEKPTPKSKSNKGVRAINDTITQRMPTFTQKQSMRRDPIYMHRQRRLNAVHELDKEIVDQGFQIKSAEGK